MAADPRHRTPEPAEARRLSVKEAKFYAAVYSSARSGALRDLRQAGCSEEEAEEVFSAAFEYVMETVDPVNRGFAQAQMVNFIKRSCHRRLIDERRHRHVLKEIELSEAHSLNDRSAQGPDEIAEEREAVAIGREALLALPDRDRQVFDQRYQQHLSPEEIRENVPGLTARSYRKIIQRANRCVLDAFERIDRGERCEEMKHRLLARYVAGQCDERESRSVGAHLERCHACRRTQARMQGYLRDVASGLAAGATLEGERSGAIGDAFVQCVDLIVQGGRFAGDATRVGRERARELLYRLGANVSGPGGDATVAQVVGVPAAKVASVCGAGAATAACVAAAVVTGGGANPSNVAGQPPPKTADSATTRSTSPPADLSAPVQFASPQTSTTPKSEAAQETVERPVKRSARGDQAESEPVPTLPSEATVSAPQTATEFGFEEAARPPPSSQSKSPSGGGGASSSGGGQSNGGGGSRLSGGGSSAEFGL
jgi:RNA polymerase sigma factor (sigma-70 family)